MSKANMDERRMQKAKRNIDDLEACLKRHNFFYSRRMDKPLFCLTIPQKEGTLGEMKAMITVRERVMCIDVNAPLTSGDKKMMARLINRLNLQQDRGTFQYDVHDGEVGLTQFISAEEVWPGDEAILKALDIGCEGVMKLHRALMNKVRAAKCDE